ncbi:hypothetical protein IPH19_03370 [Candidatus Uhrbacteria bacterium]|nr:MAG: hypothetical protein IPH19_03370 [Candidatus Uhrbacteria bacterium]
MTQPSISIIAGDFTSGLAGDVNILAGNGLGGNPAGNIYLTPGDSLDSRDISISMLQALPINRNSALNPSVEAW